MLVAEGEKGWWELRVHGADVMEERAVHFVGEEGDGRFAGNVNQVLEGFAGDDGSSRILGVAVREQGG